MNERNFLKAQDIQKMFNEIAAGYDFLNNAISLFTHMSVKKAAIKALNIEPGAKVLDLCTGSGDLGRIIKAGTPEAVVFGADYSDKMLEIARKKSSKIEYFNMDATELGFEDNSFDYVVMGFGLRNIPNKNAAIKEIYRVLKPGGKFLQLDFGQKTVFSKIFDTVTLLAAQLFTKKKEAYVYLINSKNDFPSPEKLAKIVEEQGFQCIKIKYLLFKIISFQIFKK